MLKNNVGITLSAKGRIIKWEKNGNAKKILSDSKAEYERTNYAENFTKFKR